MHLSATAVLLLIPLGEPPAGPSPFQVVADARVAASGFADGRGEEAGQALRRIQNLERAVIRRWEDDPGGPRDHLTLLVLAHCSAAEAQLVPLFGSDRLEHLRRIRDWCHLAGRAGAPAGADETFLTNLGLHRPGFRQSLNQAPSIRALVVAATSFPDRPVRFDPEEPAGGSARLRFVGLTSRVQVSEKLEWTAGGHPQLSALLFKAFKTHFIVGTQWLNDAAAAGRIGRDEYVRSSAALDQLAVANVLRALRDHFAELSDADLTHAPGAWFLPSFELFVTPAPRIHVPTECYPHSSFGFGYDRLRLNGEWTRTRMPVENYRYAGSRSRYDRLLLDAETNLRRDFWEMARRRDFWQIAVLQDRLLFHDDRSLENVRFIGGTEAELTDAGAGEVWYHFHQSLPLRVRRWLSTVRGGESIPNFCQAIAAAFHL